MIGRVTLLRDEDARLPPVNEAKGCFVMCPWQRNRLYLDPSPGFHGHLGPYVRQYPLFVV